MQALIDRGVRLFTVVMAMLLVPAVMAAQQRAPALEAVEALLNGGQTAEARAMLEQWQRDNPASARVDANVRAHAMLLTARLTTRAQAAEDAYLAVALSYPTSQHAAEALLRLGQARFAAGDTKQATNYLQRLLSDYPRTEHRQAGALWLARAQIASGKSLAACNTANDALQLNQPDSTIAAMLRAERATACNPPATVAVKTDTIASTKPAPAAPRPTPPDPVSNTASAGKFTVQVAAFRENSNAKSFARQLRNAGFEDVRLATVPDNALIRVRVGKYETSAETAAVMSKLKAAGFNAVVVADVLRERAFPE